MRRRAAGGRRHRWVWQQFEPNRADAGSSADAAGGVLGDGHRPDQLLPARADTADDRARDAQQRLLRRPHERRNLGIEQRRRRLGVIERHAHRRQRRRFGRFSATADGTRGTLRVNVVFASRTADPAPGQRLPPPNEFGEVQRLFADRPDLVARSCQPENGGTGTWEFMDELVRRLRLKDTRWGYNSRRGVPGDVARDEVAYHWGSGPDENSRDVYAWDVMGGHCGPTPTAAWIDVTSLGVLWASRGLF